MHWLDRVNRRKISENYIVPTDLLQSILLDGEDFFSTLAQENEWHNKIIICHKKRSVFEINKKSF